MIWSWILFIFMVSDKVTVETRRWDKEKGVRWNLTEVELIQLKKLIKKNEELGLFYFEERFRRGRELFRSI